MVATNRRNTSHVIHYMVRDGDDFVHWDNDNVKCFIPLPLPLCFRKFHDNYFEVSSLMGFIIKTIKKDEKGEQ